MADPDLRTLHLTTPFSMEAHTAECRALSAPGLRERFGVTPKAPALKRPHSEMYHGEEDTRTASAKKKARKAEAKRKAGQLAIKDRDRQSGAPPPPQLALEDRRPEGGRGGDKGKGKGKKGPLPKGIKSKTEGNKMVCYAWNQGRACKSADCQMAHVCWFCHKDSHRGDNCKNKPAQA